MFLSIFSFHFYHLQGLVKKKERDNICIFQKRGRHFQGNEILIHRKMKFSTKTGDFQFIIILHFAVEFMSGHFLLKNCSLLV